MAATNNSASYDDIDEVEEEALLKSDDEDDGSRSNTDSQANLMMAPPPLTENEEECLLNESAQLPDPDDPARIAAGFNESDQIKLGNANGKQADSDDGDIDGDVDDIDDDVDDDDDDDEEMDEADKILKEFNRTLSELENNQYAYEKYVQLCELSHATCDLENIRTAYNLFASVYPLASNFWLKYLSVEVNMALSPTEVEKVENLFRKALADYFSTEIALEYAEFAARTADPQRVWDEILGTYALHCLRGQEFFKRYRRYVASHPTMSADEKQKAYIQSFQRELKYPLLNMEESYIEFKVFYERNKTEAVIRDLDWTQIDTDYFKAKEDLQRILPFEQQLESIDMKCYRERGDVYAAFIKESDKFLDENVLQTVYERMVADCCLNADCWLTYINFLDYRDEFGRPQELQDLPLFRQDALDVNNRALRNCTWSAKLYIKRIHLLEKQEKTREEIQEVLESSLSAGFQTADPAVAIWLEYLTYLRRHTDWENEAECDILRKNFNLAWTILGQQWGVLADCNCEILQFWGRLEYGPLQDAKRGKELWTTVMESSDNATKSGLWIEFAQLEMRRDLEATRKLYRKALHVPGLDNPPVVASAWERFERCNGTIKTLSTCTKETTDFLLNYQAQQHQYVGASKTTTIAGKGTKRKSTTSNDPVVHEKKSKPSPTKKDTKVVAEAKPHETAFKEHENQAIDLSKDHLRIFLSNLDYNLTEEELIAGLPELKVLNINLIRTANGRSRGFGYLELESEADVEKALALDRRSLNGRPLFISSVLRDKEKRQKFKYSEGVEPKKLFVKGLPPDASKEELEMIFSSFGKLTDVRLVYHKSGKFKNIAYVEFAEEGAAGKAVLATDQLEIRGHNLSVAISAPPPKPTVATVNPIKLLGIAAKRNKVFDQKPRMSLIPNVVRRKLTAPQTTANGTAATTPAKTNSDFRKLLAKP